MAKEENVNIYIPYTRQFVSEQHEGDTSQMYSGYIKTIYNSSVDGTFSWESPKDTYDYAMESVTAALKKKNPEKLYACYVIYSDGGTFGESTGYVHIAGIFENFDDAKAAARKIQKRGQEGYRDGEPWTGYFSSLEEVGVKELVCGQSERSYKVKF